MGVRGPQIEPNDLTLDRLINVTNAILETTSGIDLTTTGTQTIMTASQKTFVLGVLLRVSFADTVTSPASASVGVSPATNDVFADVTLVDLNQVNELYTFWSNTNTGAVLNTSENLILSINTAATAIVLQVTAHVIGFLP